MVILIKLTKNELFIKKKIVDYLKNNELLKVVMNVCKEAKLKKRCCEVTCLKRNVFIYKR
jgi:hypothetical protein